MSVEVAIPQRYHRAIMGPKGCRIQHITREHEVQIKFPERDDSAAGDKQDAAAAPTLPGQNGVSAPDYMFRFNPVCCNYRSGDAATGKW